MTKLLRTRAFYESCAVIAALGAASPSWAQTASTSAPAAESAAETDSGEIVVTAQKRAQKLNDVGISIVAATGDQLRTSGVTEVSQLTKIAPGFSVGSNYQGLPVFSLRGINFNAGQFSAPPAVSTYIDEAILPYSAMTGGLLLDVDHVEVLKGPQGTLFGQNATGGSINVIAAKPTSKLTAGFNADVNNYGQVIFGGFVSGPLSDTLRFRLAAQTTQFGSYQRSPFVNNRTNGDQNKGAARLLLDWTPTDQLTVAVNLNANYDHGEALQIQYGGPATGQVALYDLSRYPIASSGRDAGIPIGFDSHKRNELYQAVLRLDYKFSDAATLTSITNYIDFKSSTPSNITGVSYPGQRTVTIGNDQTFSEELHLSGELVDNKLNYIIGANYSRDKVFEQELIVTDAYSAFGPLPPGITGVFDTAYRPITTQKAVFGNIDFKITPELTFTAGARYTSVKEETIGCTGGNFVANGLFSAIAGALRAFVYQDGQLPYTGVAGPCQTINDDVNNFRATAGPRIGTLVPDLQPIANNTSQSENNVSWRAGLNYKVAQNSLIYGLISRGYKAGLYPVQPDILHSGFNPVKQEQLTSYEVGAKLDLLDHAVRINAAAFYYDYRDKQFFSYFIAPILGATSTIKNVPKSTAKGVEVDVTIAPVQGLTLRAAATYLKTEVGQFVTTNFDGRVINVAGSEFNYSPPFSASFDAEYRFPAGNGLEAYVGGSGLYNSRTFGDLGQNPIQLIPKYLVLDARVGVQSDKGWSLGLYVRNLTDKYYYTATFFAGDTIGRVGGAPRTFGATAGFKF